MTQMFNPPHPGRQLGEAINDSGMTREEFAQKTGIHISMLTKIIEGETPIVPAASVLIAAAFGNSQTHWSRMSDEHYAWQAAHR